MHRNTVIWAGTCSAILPAALLSAVNVAMAAESRFNSAAAPGLFLLPSRRPRPRLPMLGAQEDTEVRHFFFGLT
jgi:hypothetical protein